MGTPAHRGPIQSWPPTCWDPGTDRERGDSHDYNPVHLNAANSVSLAMTRLPARIANALDAAELTTLLQIACIVFFEDIRKCSPWTPTDAQSTEKIEWDHYRQRLIWSNVLVPNIPGGELETQPDEQRMWHQCYQHIDCALNATSSQLKKGGRPTWRSWCNLAVSRPDIRARCADAARIVLSVRSNRFKQDHLGNEDIEVLNDLGYDIIDVPGSARLTQSGARKRTVLGATKDSEDEILPNHPKQTSTLTQEMPYPKRRKPQLVPIHVIELIYNKRRASRTGEEAWIVVPPALNLEELEALVCEETSELGTLATATTSEQVSLFAMLNSSTFVALFTDASLIAALQADGLELFVCARPKSLPLKQAVRTLLEQEKPLENLRSSSARCLSTKLGRGRKHEHINHDQPSATQSDDNTDDLFSIKQESDTDDEILVIKREIDVFDRQVTHGSSRPIKDTSPAKSNATQWHVDESTGYIGSCALSKPWKHVDEATLIEYTNRLRDADTHGPNDNAHAIYRLNNPRQSTPLPVADSSSFGQVSTSAKQQSKPASSVQPITMHNHLKSSLVLPAATTSFGLPMNTRHAFDQMNNISHRPLLTSSRVDHHSTDTRYKPRDSSVPLLDIPRMTDPTAETLANENGTHEVLEEGDPELELGEGSASTLDQDETMRISLGIERATADLPLATQLNVTMVNEFCRWRGLDPAYWQPDTSVVITGFRGLVKETHLFTAYFLLKTESTLDPTGRQRIGGVLGHHMGVGKTACALVLHVMNLLERVRALQVDSARAQATPIHCPSSARPGSRCPSGRVGGTHGWRCPCEPDRPKLSTTDGVTVAMVPLHTIGSWGTEIAKRVDLEALAKTLPLPPVWALAHEKTTIETMPHLVRWEDAAIALRAKPVTTADWLALNPGVTAFELPLLWRTEPRPHAPPYPSRRDLSHVFVLTTPQSAPTRLFPDAQVTYRPGYPRQLVPCRPDGRTCVVNKASCTAKAHIHQAMSWSVTGIRWGRFILDEAHTSPMRTITSKIRSLIAEELELREGTPPAVWLATGTPMSTAPTGLLGLWAGWFNDRNDLASCDSLSPFVPERIQAAVNADHLLVESIKNPRLTQSSKAWKEVGGSPSSQPVAPEDVHNTWVAHAQPTLQAWMDRAWIRFTLETEWTNRRLIPLPKRTDCVITLAPYRAEDTDRLTALIQTHRSSTRAYQEALATQAVASRRVLDSSALQTLHRIQVTNGRRLRILLTCPRLHNLLGDADGYMNNALTKTIQAKGWYETPGTSPFARFAGPGSAQELYVSSPRFQEMVRQVHARPVVTDTYGCEDEIRTETHHDPIVLGVTEDAIGLAALIVLRHYCASRYKNGLAIQVLHSKTPDREELIRRFQRTGLRRSDGIPIDVLILNVRTAATGITLHRADLFMWLDPCLIPARLEQAPARIYRVGQERPVTVLTTINQLHDVEGQWVAQAQALTRKTQELQDRKAAGPRDTA